ncbi:hypothetical protein KM043_004443 [Ampulex compressa]|nr:hypothetical protein KM043_004443 [Ampulex compressa]
MALGPPGSLRPIDSIMKRHPPRRLPSPAHFRQQVALCWIKKRSRGFQSARGDGGQVFDERSRRDIEASRLEYWPARLLEAGRKLREGNVPSRKFA